MSSPCSLTAVSMIHTKRWNQRPHTDDEIKWWIESYTRGDVPDYQMSAWLMAVCWRGMTADETASLCKYMVQSGQVLKWPVMGDKKLVDKHSTGGVGDKISLILAPLVASCGVSVPMMAGRGLDHTGGTLDKLESIPGYATDFSIERFQQVVSTVGCSIVSAGRDMVLADRKLYALRDVTGTVSAIPLQTASIVSKKIAEGPDALVLDVKYGRAAFQENVSEALTLAHSMIATAEANQVKPTTAFLTRMEHPIGHAVGNWLEVKECIELLKSRKGASDLVQLVVVEAAQMLVHSDAFPDKSWDELVDLVLRELKGGNAYLKFREMVAAHGGDVSVLDDPSSYPAAQYQRRIVAAQDGYISDIDALVVGRAAVDLGAGRSVADEPVDATAGIWIYKKVGDAVQNGETIACVFTNKDEGFEAVTTRVESAISYSREPVPVYQVITHRVTSTGMEEFDIPMQLLD